jgi:hypothetical protein
VAGLRVGIATQGSTDKWGRRWTGVGQVGCGWLCSYGRLYTRTYVLSKEVDRREWARALSVWEEGRNGWREGDGCRLRPRPTVLPLQPDPLHGGETARGEFYSRCEGLTALSIDSNKLPLMSFFSVRNRVRETCLGRLERASMCFCLNNEHRNKQNSRP